MKRIAATIATAVLLTGVLLASPASAEEAAVVDCASQQSEIERMTLVNFNLAMENTELRDEWADEVRDLKDDVLEERDERLDAEASLDEARYQIGQRDARIDRLIGRVRLLRARLAAK